VTDDATEHVKQIARVLRQSTGFVRVLPVPRARCPVVKFIHASSGIKCDISINNWSAAEHIYIVCSDKTFSHDGAIW